MTMQRTNKQKFLTRTGVLAILATVAVLCSFLTTYEQDVDLISRQAAEVVGISTFLTDLETTATATVKSCERYGTSQLSSTNGNKLVIDKTKVRAQSKHKLEQLKRFTVPNYEQYMMDDPGREHYTLWHYLTQTYHAPDDCRHVVDIGTRYVASALALGATGVTVKTFDIPTSKERNGAFRQKTEQEWQQELQVGENVHVEFYNLDLLQISDQDFQQYMATWLIVLDTFHQPYTVPFEREFLDRLVNMPQQHKYQGIVLLDDIHLNPEMRQWWKEVTDNAEKWGYKAYDLTSVGHVSGTGLLDFSGKVVIAG